MGQEEQASQATPQEIKENRRRCRWTGCKHRAFYEDWAGWHFCLYHWWYTTKDSVEGRGLKYWWWYIKNSNFKM